MSALHIRDVPEETIAALKEKAARNGRSMQQELLAIVGKAAHEPPPPRRRRLDLTFVDSGHTEAWDRADIYD